MAKIIIPTPLRKFTENERSYVTENGNNVKNSIQELVETYPDLRKNLLDENDQVRSFIKIFVEDKEVKPEESGKVEVDEDTVISIVPAIAGGCYALL